jgi:hypothetical protein
VAETAVLVVLAEPLVLVNRVALASAMVSAVEAVETARPGKLVRVPKAATAEMEPQSTSMEQITA